MRQITALRPTVEYAALLADHHLGYVVPIGGVVASQELLSLAGVGYDIRCGNKAVRLDADPEWVKRNIPQIMDRIAAEISFGLGRVRGWELDDPLFYAPAWDEVPALQQRDKRGRELRAVAREQLGTVGSGNHYVNVMLDEEDRVWVAVHFGSRGLGHRIATWFMDAAGAQASVQGAHVQLHYRSDLGAQYLQALELASRYAYAGRDAVVARVVDLVGGDVADAIRVNHNGIWRERHNGLDYFVARKGSTPCWPGERCFVGGSMGDDSVVLEGVDSPLARELFQSTVHGAGRVMSRTKATGRSGWGRKKAVSEPGISRTSALPRCGIDFVAINSGAKTNGVRQDCR